MKFSCKMTIFDILTIVCIHLNVFYCKCDICTIYYAHFYIYSNANAQRIFFRFHINQIHEGYNRFFLIRSSFEIGALRRFIFLLYIGSRYFLISQNIWLVVLSINYTVACESFLITWILRTSLFTLLVY